MNTNQSESTISQKLFQRNVRIIGALFAVGGFGFMLLMEFNPLAIILGAISMIIGTTAAFYPRAVKTVSLMLAEMFSLGTKAP